MLIKLRVFHLYNKRRAFSTQYVVCSSCPCVCVSGLIYRSKRVPEGLGMTNCIMRERSDRSFGCERSEPSRQDRAPRSDSAAERGPTACMQIDAPS